jgi:hypothetical protein
VDRVERDASNAWRYRMDYAFAMTMMGVPLFFFETQLLSNSNRELLKPIIATYKRHRDDLRRGTVFPIGEEPDDTRWCGFQSVAHEGRSGYLTLFREIDNREATRSVPLHFLNGSRALRLTNLMTGGSQAAAVGEGGEVSFAIDQPGAYRFFRYELA